MCSQQKNNANEIWAELEKIHVGSKKLLEKNIKCLRKNTMSSKCFLMNWMNKYTSD